MKILVPLIIFLIFVFLYFFFFEYRKTQNIEDIHTIKKICLEGHIYFYTSGLNEGGIAPKLNDDGTPCKCQEKLEEEK